MINNTLLYLRSIDNGNLNIRYYSSKNYKLSQRVIHKLKYARRKQQIKVLSIQIASLIDIHYLNGDDKCVSIIGNLKYEIL